MEPLQPETQTGRNTCTELDGFLGRGGFFFIKKKCNIIKPAYKPLEKISPSILVQNSHPISSLSHVRILVFCLISNMLISLRSQKIRGFLT